MSTRLRASISLQCTLEPHEIKTPNTTCSSRNSRDCWGFVDSKAYPGRVKSAVPNILETHYYAHTLAAQGRSRFCLHMWMKKEPTTPKTNSYVKELIANAERASPLERVAEVPPSERKRLPVHLGLGLRLGGIL